jgi:acyl CoA:acetate/3-ketoacid CoA transferase beta subunit
VSTTTAQRADVCVLAVAEAFRGDANRVISPMGLTPRLGALLAWSTFEPDLLISDGEAQLLAGPVPIGAEADAPKEGWLPFRDVFQMVNAGTRHVMMGATQIDRHGNQNISVIGDWKQPKVQLLGARGAPGNTANHTTSYWVAGHSPKIFVDQVDFVSGLGTDRAAQLPGVKDLHELRRVITDLAVLDLGGPEGTMRLVSVHPGITVQQVLDATGFELDVPEDPPTTTEPTAEQLAVINHLDPRGLRFREVPRAVVA